MPTQYPVYIPSLLLIDHFHKSWITLCKQVPWDHIISIVAPCILKSSHFTRQQMHYLLTWLKVLNLCPLHRTRFRCNEQGITYSVNKIEEELVLYIPHSKVFWTEVTRLWFTSQIKKVVYFIRSQECGTKFSWLLSLFYMSVPVDARSKAWVFRRSHAEIMGSNPTWVIDVCVLWVLCFVKYRFLRRADHPSWGNAAPNKGQSRSYMQLWRSEFYVT